MITQIIEFIILVVFIFVLSEVANRKKWPSVIKEKPKKLLSFSSQLGFDIVMDKIQTAAQNSKYIIEDINKQDSRIILGKKAGGWNLGYGYFYSIYISEMENSETLIEIETKSRLHFMGIRLLIQKEQKNIFEWVKRILST